MGPLATQDVCLPRRRPGITVVPDVIVDSDVTVVTVVNSVAITVAVLLTVTVMLVGTTVGLAIVYVVTATRTLAFDVNRNFGIHDHIPNGCVTGTVEVSAGPSPTVQTIVLMASVPEVGKIYEAVPATVRRLLSTLQGTIVCGGLGKASEVKTGAKQVLVKADPAAGFQTKLAVADAEAAGHAAQSKSIFSMKNPPNL